jgi:hypothetical protein
VLGMVSTFFLYQATTTVSPSNAPASHVPLFHAEALALGGGRVPGAIMDGGAVGSTFLETISNETNVLAELAVVGKHLSISLPTVFFLFWFSYA